MSARDLKTGDGARLSGLTSPENSGSVPDIFAVAGDRAKAMGLAYAGAVTPTEAFTLAEAGAGKIVDVRTPPEYHDIGHVSGTPLVEWPRTGGDEELRRFIEEIAERFEPAETLLLLCRSGVRSHYAAHILSQAGYGRAYNILEGFEGPVHGQGWRAAGLPWTREG